ncbi:MAG: 4'-phosphopantetheinyl transferase superfamily protein [Pseudomonadota bacterium]
MSLNKMSSTSNSFLFPSRISNPWTGMDRLESACLGMILLPISALFPCEEDLFTPREREKIDKMGPRRQKSFMAARVALKRLARQLGLVEENRPDGTIETLGPDAIRPCLADSGVNCSVSHSGPRVVAVAHRHPVGVDIEGVSKKALRALQSFWIGGEHGLISISPLGPERAATRAWTGKEAAAKALGLHLFQALGEIEVLSLGEFEGRIRYQDKTYPIRHCEGDGQVITLITCDDL